MIAGGPATSTRMPRADAAPWTDAQKEDVVDEVLLAYAMNTALLADLDRDRREIA